MSRRLRSTMRRIRRRHSLAAAARSISRSAFLHGAIDPHCLPWFRGWRLAHPAGTSSAAVAAPFSSENHMHLPPMPRPVAHRGSTAANVG